MFVSTFRNCMKILLGIMKHQNTLNDTVIIGFDILDIIRIFIIINNNNS